MTVCDTCKNSVSQRLACPRCDRKNCTHCRLRGGDIEHGEFPGQCLDEEECKFRSRRPEVSLSRGH